MIINQDGGPVVPDKTIAVFTTTDGFNAKDIDLFLKPLNTTHKRDWFDQGFYSCLPLSIGNMQGFVVVVPYDIKLIWNGGNTPNDISIEYPKNFLNNKQKNSTTANQVEIVKVNSHFGHGIFTINLPITLKTPPGINLMTIAPPNFPLVGLSPMTGVVESDNIRFHFTLNIKIDLINTLIEIPANTPLIGLLPIPRYFCDSFKLVDACEIFDKDIVNKEKNIVGLHTLKRTAQLQNDTGLDKLYFNGMDIKKNKFKDHQLPKKKKT
jgi:hypothetical protein